MVCLLEFLQVLRPFLLMRNCSTGKLFENKVTCATAAFKPNFALYYIGLVCINSKSRTAYYLLYWPSFFPWVMEMIPNKGFSSFCPLIRLNSSSPYLLATASGKFDYFFSISTLLPHMHTTNHNVLLKVDKVQLVLKICLVLVAFFPSNVRLKAFGHAAVLRHF